MEIQDWHYEELQNIWYILDKLGAINVEDLFVDRWYHSSIMGE